METGIITSGFDRINSHLSVITLHGNSSTVASFRVLISAQRKHDETRLPCGIIFPPVFLTFCPCLTLSPSKAVLRSLSPPSLHPTQISAFHCCLPPTCYLATELTCPLFSALQICNPTFHGITYINPRSPRGAELCSLSPSEQLRVKACC